MRIANVRHEINSFPKAEARMHALEIQRQERIAMSATQTTATRPHARDGFHSEACNRALATVVVSILRFASRAFRRTEPVWFDLNDHFLADIGVTRAEAEAEAARCLWRTPLGTMADRVTSQDLPKPRLRTSRFGLKAAIARRQSVVHDRLAMTASADPGCSCRGDSGRRAIRLFETYLDGYPRRKN
jgi:uncharacterized protein YjiS (DUF1127 family)